MEFERFAILKLEAQSSKLEALNKAAAASPFSAASLTFRSTHMQPVTISKLNQFSLADAAPNLDDFRLEFNGCCGALNGRTPPSTQPAWSKPSPFACWRANRPDRSPVLSPFALLLQLPVVDSACL
jgi:hypothetical protein